MKGEVAFMLFRKMLYFKDCRSAGVELFEGQTEVVFSHSQVTAVLLDMCTVTEACL